MSNRRGVIVALALIFLPWASPSAQTNQQIWAELTAGGRVVLMRHAITTPGVGDPPGMKLEDCATQRNLTDEGRQHARKIGAAFAASNIRVGRVLASPWCRCLETARLAFGRADAWQPLSNLFGRSENQAKQVDELRAMVSQPALANTVLVSHGSTIAALTGVSLDTGEMLIVAPQGAGQFRVVGRLSVDPR